jgi:hypothetical protein
LLALFQLRVIKIYDPDLAPSIERTNHTKVQFVYICVLEKVRYTHLLVLEMETTLMEEMIVSMLILLLALSLLMVIHTLSALLVVDTSFLWV